METQNNYMITDGDIFTVQRAAEEAVKRTGIAQMVHHHIYGAGCVDECELVTQGSLES